jgi:capsular exopolysaccharide synthesis family protein
LPLGLLLGLTAAAAVYLIFEPVYEAFAWLRIEETVPFIAFEHRSEGRSFFQTQVELIRSPIVLGPVISDAEIAKIREIARQDDRIRWLASQLKVKTVGQSELFTVSFACSDPAASARVVNAVVDAYFTFRDQEQTQKNQRVVEILQREKERKGTEVTQLRDNVRELAKQVTGKDPFAASSEPNSPQARPLADLQNRLIAAEVDEAVLNAKARAFEEMAAKQRVSISEAMLDKAVAENPQVQKVTAQALDKKAKLQRLESISAKGKESPTYRQAAEEVAREEQLLAKLHSEARKEAKEQLEMSLNGKREEELAALRSDLESRRITKQLLRDRYENEVRSAKQYSGDTLSLKFKQDELARAEKVFDLISDRALRLQTEQGAPPRVSRLNKAEAPASPMEKLPLPKMLLAMLGGLCLPFALAVFKEKIARRVSDPMHLEQQAHLAVIGEIARLSPRNSVVEHHRRKGIDRAARLFEESVDSLRTHLFLSPDLREARVLAVTSAVNHEGKTSVAAQLAVSIARALQELTLLVDGDLRSPSLHKVFDLALEPGATKVFSGECPLEDAVQATWLDRLHVLPAGRLQGSPHRLLAGGAVQSLLEKVPAKYCYVIIDTPPVLAASESLVLAKASDAVLMCTMRDVSRVSQVKKASDLLASAGCRMAGTVLSGVPVRQYVHRYGAYAYSSE